jgi:hypothetical protein
MIIRIEGCNVENFRAFRTTEDETELYTETGVVAVKKSEIFYIASKVSVSTFFSE